tara:strand:- start:489 stop:1241 length:753 start_codon:yes stop_codon:yes gene_type:complete
MKFIIGLSIIINYAFSITGLEIAELVESRLKPIDIKSTNTMTLTNKDNKIKKLELISMSKGNSKKQMIWFLEPKKDMGIAFLKIENEEDEDFMTMWLPGFSRFKRIKSSQKSDSFMGSDLSFEDLTNRNINDYEYKLVDENASCSDYETGCYKLISEPKNVDSEYSYHITWITKDNYLSVIEESYDKNKELLKKKLIEFEKMDEYYIMNKLNVKNIQKNHSTLLEIQNISLNNDFKDSKFSQRSLKIIPK